MPLPPAPTRRLDNAANRRTDRKADNEMLVKGGLCAVIGLAVLLAPYVVASPGVRGVVAQAALVGWFALLLGCAFIVLALWRRWVASAKA